MIKVLKIEEAEKWDSIVRSFADYDVYWLSGYVKAFRIHGDGEPLLLYYEGSGRDKGLRGINVVMSKDISDDPFFYGKIDERKYYDLKTPYGYGGWLIEGEDTEQLFLDYERWAHDNHIVSEFVRFHPVIGNHRQREDCYDVISLGEVVTMDLRSPELIWENISSKNRNVIRKAAKNDVTIYNGRYPEIFNRFKDIYNSTMDKDKAEKYYYFEREFYESVLNDLPESAQVFYAQKDNVVIAAAIMLCTNGMINYHLSGSLREYSSFGATNLILYKTALWGCANGYKSLYLGGGVGAGEDGLFRFKKAFYKGNLQRFYIGKKIFDEEMYSKLMEIRIRDESFDSQTTYFPAYRSGGKIGRN